MAKPLKTAGAAELAAFERRVRRQLAMERISTIDADYILDHCEYIKSRLTEMSEDGEEDFS